MYNSRILKFFLFGMIIAALISGSAASLDTGSVKVSVAQKMSVAGNELKAGQYVVQWEPNGTGSSVTFKSDEGFVVKVAGKITKMEKKSQHTSLLSAKDPDGHQILKAIELGEKQIRIAFE
jgi:hypothetical protein